MTWTLLIVLAAGLGVALAAAVARDHQLRRMRETLGEREEATRSGRNKAQLQHPVVDLTRCLGCATCIAVCPEDEVLELVHGQAVVLNPSRCVGVAACERECPVGAITVTIANLEEREDIPAFESNLEAVGSPGLFLAGEVTAHALIKTAVEHGTAVAAEVAQRVKKPVTVPATDGATDAAADRALDLCIVGAGPAGLACSLEAKRQGLSFVTLDKESALGGTVAKYPRRKLVMSEPVHLPLHGRMRRSTYEKEELIDLWNEVATKYELPIVHGALFQGLDRNADGHFVVRTDSGNHVARHVCLAIGRRGVPRELGVPGESLPKTAYSLLDAGSYRGRRVLVVGGGDSAVEAALGLAEQPGNEVTLSYRGESFHRIRKKNETRLDAQIAAGKIEVVFQSEVVRIESDRVELSVRNGAAQPLSIPNDDVFVMAGGTPPVELLASAGVSFDHSARPAAATVTEQGGGLVRALAIGFALSLGALAWAWWHADYYLLTAAERALHDKHALLRPGQSVGLALGVTAASLIAVNLLYLLRRSGRLGFRFGSLRGWMTSHVATGILALLLAALHGAMAPGDTAAGHSLWALAILLVTGAIGRYFYAYVPRAANGRELALAEVRSQLDALTAMRDDAEFAQAAREEVRTLAKSRQWKGSFFGRVIALLGVQRELRRALATIEMRGREEGVPEDLISDTLRLARDAHRHALMAAHYEDLRALLSSWRYLHRWVAALMLLLLAVHIFSALFYGAAEWAG
ncbi:MAG: NAD(P)-binding domain-containing protein [Planctomycetota bacterium]